MKKQLERITEELGKRGKDAERAEDNHGGETLSSSKAKSVEFVFAKYDELMA